MGTYKWGVSPLIWVISIVTLLMTLIITTHEPPSRVLEFGLAGWAFVGFMDRSRNCVGPL